MKKFLYPFVAFFLVVILLIVFNDQIKDNKGEVLSSTTKSTNQEKNLSPQGLNSQYEEAAKSIFLILNALTKPVNSEADLDKRLESLVEVKETLLSLRVPAQYQNLHLSLVATADQLEKRLLEKQFSLANQEVKEKNFKVDFTDAQEKINNLTNEYSWLKTL